MNKVAKAIIKKCIMEEPNLLKYVKNKVVGCKYNHILVAAMLKSGGTYLTTTLSLLPNYKKTRFVHACGRREQELSAIKLMCQRHNYVAHHHLRYSDTTEVFINAFCLKPVILVRDVFDTVVSMKDYIRKGNIINQVVYILPEMTGLGDDKVSQLRATNNLLADNTTLNSASAEWPANDELLEEFLIDMFLPWYFNFYLSWCDCRDKVIVTYEEMNRDMCATIRKIANYHSLRVSDMDIQRAIMAANETDTRKNKAVIGRGNELSDRLKEKVIRMSDYYKGTDFSAIGLHDDLRG